MEHFYKFLINQQMKRNSQIEPFSLQLSSDDDYLITCSSTHLRPLANQLWSSCQLPIAIVL